MQGPLASLRQITRGPLPVPSAWHSSPEPR
jgi:hypothetical protein